MLYRGRKAVVSKLRNKIDQPNSTAALNKVENSDHLILR